MANQASCGLNDGFFLNNPLNQWREDWGVCMRLLRMYTHRPQFIEKLPFFIHRGAPMTEPKVGDFGAKTA